MMEAGAAVILDEPGVAEFGVFFSAPDLAKKVFLAMASQASQHPDASR
jgi:hypothetical protein